MLLGGSLIAGTGPAAAAAPTCQGEERAVELAPGTWDCLDGDGLNNGWVAANFKAWITGQAMVGNTLGTVLDERGKSNTLDWQLQWNRNGKPISGATGWTYKLTSADAGARISLTFTAYSGAIRANAKTTGASAPVKPLTLLNTRRPNLFGSPHQGVKMSVKYAEWSARPASVSYQWKRNGAAIKGATTSSYTLTPADNGRVISVTLTAKRAGYANGTVTLSAGKASQRALRHGHEYKGKPHTMIHDFTKNYPTVNPSPKAGQSVRGFKPLTPPIVEHAPDKVTGQWLLNGKPVAGNRGKFLIFDARKADAGKKLSYRVTLTKKHYKTLVLTSPARTIRK